MMHDDAIIELYNQRNENAIEETSKKYGCYCRSIANNILADAQDTEECVNDTLLKAWESIPPQHPRSLKAYLAKVTRNLSLNRYRDKNCDKRGGGEVALALDEMEEFLAGTTDITSEIERKEFANMLGGFLRSLPARDRSIFILRYFYMDSVASIAKQKALKETNVLMILSRTRKKLKIELEREGYTV